MMGLVFVLLLAACATPQAGQATLPAQPGVELTQAALPRQPGASTNTAQSVVINPQSNGPASVIDGPLSVVIESPADNAVVNQSPLEISGQADPQTVLTINDTIVLIEKDRRFSVKVDLVEGINIIEMIASDQDENQEIFYLTVDYEKQP